MSNGVTLGLGVAVAVAGLGVEVDVAAPGVDVGVLVAVGAGVVAVGGGGVGVKVDVAVGGVVGVKVDVAVGGVVGVKVDVAVGVNVAVKVDVAVGVNVAVAPITVTIALSQPRSPGWVMHASLVIRSPLLAPEVMARDRSRAIVEPLKRVESVCHVIVPEVLQPSIVKSPPEMSEEPSTVALLQSVSDGMTSLTSIPVVQSLPPSLATSMW